MRRGARPNVQLKFVLGDYSELSQNSTFSASSGAVHPLHWHSRPVSDIWWRVRCCGRHAGAAGAVHDVAPGSGHGRDGGGQHPRQPAAHQIFWLHGSSCCLLRHSHHHVPHAPGWVSDSIRSALSSFWAAHEFRRAVQAWQASEQSRVRSAF